METRATWYPLHEMRRLQREMEHLFSEVAPARRWPLTGEYPPINVARNEKGVTIDALCPGCDRSTFEITVVGDAVTIRGERRQEPGVSEDRYQRRERPFGSFVRTVSMGQRLDPERTQATYNQGLLRVQLAPAPEAAPKKIPIQN
jgi:HSP20 family protein